MRDRLQALTGSLARSFAFSGVAVQHKGSREVVTACAPGITLATDRRPLFRVASLSKIITGQVFAIVARQAGIAAPYDLPVAEVLGWPLTHPSGGATTLGQLASHSAGLTDAAGYAVPPDQTLAAWMRDKGPAIFGPHPPGQFMSYSNLGYILLAACAEVLGADRFDHLAARLVLEPMGIDGGFNWSGVADPDRHAALPTFRRDGADFVPQIDSNVPPGAELAFPGDTPLTPDNYKPGQNPGIFSPQGGLRTSLTGTLALALALPAIDHTRLWDHQRGAGDYIDGLMQDYGLGLQLLPDPPFYPRPLIGHFGNAYGFAGGAWHDTQTGASFSYALNGLPLGDESDALSPSEQLIFQTIAQITA